MDKKLSVAEGNAEHMGFLSVQTVVGFECAMLSACVFSLVFDSCKSEPH